MKEFVKYLFGPFGKIVRSKQIITMVRNGVIVESSKLKPQEHLKELLLRKLPEEIEEVLKSKSRSELIEELADTKQVLSDLSKYKCSKNFLKQSSNLCIEDISKDLRFSGYKYSNRISELTVSLNYELKKIVSENDISNREIEDRRRSKQNERGNFSQGIKVISVEFDKNQHTSGKFVTNFENNPHKYIKHR